MTATKAPVQIPAPRTATSPAALTVKVATSRLRDVLRFSARTDAQLSDARIALARALATEGTLWVWATVDLIEAEIKASLRAAYHAAEDDNL